MIRYTTFETEVGKVLIAATERGIVALGIGSADAELERWLRRKCRNEPLERADEGLRRWQSVVRGHLNGDPNHQELPLDVRGTEFQKRVWKELQRIRRGETKTYAEVAAALGKPSAARAVARACATNPVSLVIPCHRVVRTGGGLGGYGWGLECKQKLLEMERK